MEKISVEKSQIDTVISEKKKEGLLLKERHINLDGSNDLIFYNPAKDEIKSPFDKWLDACPDEKIKYWIKEGKEFFK